MPYDPSIDPNRYNPYSPISPARDVVPVASGVEYPTSVALRVYVPTSVSAATVNVVGANTGGVSRALKFGPGTFICPLMTISATWSDSNVEIHRYV